MSRWIIAQQGVGPSGLENFVPGNFGELSVFPAVAVLKKCRTRCFCALPMNISSVQSTLRYPQMKHPKLGLKDPHDKFSDAIDFHIFSLYSGCSYRAAAEVYKWEGQLRMDYACQRMTYVGSCLEWVTNSVVTGWRFFHFDFLINRNRIKAVQTSSH